MIRFFKKIKKSIDTFIYNYKNYKFTSDYMSRDIPESMTEEEMVEYLRKKIDEFED